MTRLIQALGFTGLIHAVGFTGLRQTVGSPRFTQVVDYTVLMESFGVYGAHPSCRKYRIGIDIRIWKVNTRCIVHSVYTSFGIRRVNTSCMIRRSDKL